MTKKLSHGAVEDMDSRRIESALNRVERQEAAANALRNLVALEVDAGELQQAMTDFVAELARVGEFDANAKHVLQLAQHALRTAQHMRATLAAVINLSLVD